jgi:hypothetical protein
VFIAEVEGEGGKAWREISVSPGTFRIDGMNKLAMCYLTRQFETIRFEGQDEEST